jgi:hypothetical protein
MVNVVVIGIEDTDITGDMMNETTGVTEAIDADHGQVRSIGTRSAIGEGRGHGRGVEIGARELGTEDIEMAAHADHEKRILIIKNNTCYERWDGVRRCLVHMDSKVRKFFRLCYSSIQDSRHAVYSSS